jgi:anhydro-N-acetylmuramic acid kinase
MKKRLVIGCMSGTSLDAVDVALVEIEGRGLEMRASLLRGHSFPFRTLSKILRPVTQRRPKPVGDIARYAVMIGMSYSVAIQKLLEAGEEKPDLIGLHGQTVYHEPPNSMQLINPHHVALEYKVPVAFDFRGADIAAGGGGAPITPLADHVLFRDAKQTRAVLNLGGFANYTWLPATRKKGEAAAASIRGADICACNQLLDFIARRWFKKKYDAAGQRAAHGIVHPEAEEFLRMMLEAQARDGRSLGTGDEAMDWAKSFQHHCNGEDLAATACAVIGQVIGQTIRDADQIILAGGGAENRTLVDGLRAHTKAQLIDSDTVGVPGQYREAMCMAVLTALARDGVSITLPQVTGRFADCAVGPCWINP